MIRMQLSCKRGGKIIHGPIILLNEYHEFLTLRRSEMLTVDLLIKSVLRSNITTTWKTCIYRFFRGKHAYIPMLCFEIFFAQTTSIVTVCFEISSHNIFYYKRLLTQRTRVTNSTHFCRCGFTVDRILFISDSLMWLWGEFWLKLVFILAWSMKTTMNNESGEHGGNQWRWSATNLY